MYCLNDVCGTKSDDEDACYSILVFIQQIILLDNHNHNHTSTHKQEEVERTNTNCTSNNTNTATISLFHSNDIKVCVQL